MNPIHVSDLPAYLEEVQRRRGKPVGVVSRPARRKTEQPEAALQQTCVAWFDQVFVPSLPKAHRALVYRHHSPNGGLRHKAVAGKLKAQGTNSGFPDLLVIVNGQHIYFELKAGHNGLSPEQKEFRDLCTRMMLPYHVVRSLEQFETHVRTAYACAFPTPYPEHL